MRIVYRSMRAPAIRHMRHLGARLFGECTWNRRLRLTLLWIVGRIKYDKNWPLGTECGGSYGKVDGHLGIIGSPLRQRQPLFAGKKGLRMGCKRFSERRQLNDATSLPSIIKLIKLIVVSEV